MSFFLTFLTLLLFSFLATQALQHECIHDQTELNIQVGDPSHSPYSAHNSRILTEYQNIKIIADVSTLVTTSDALKNYITNDIMPTVLNYFEAALKAPARNSLLTIGGLTTVCGGDITVPSIYNTVGVDADLILFIKAVNAPNAAYVASAAACVVDATTNRPVVGKMTYNLARVSPTTNDAVREGHIMVTMHELTHVLGFSSGLYQYYMNPSTGKLLTGHVIKTTSMGMETTILDLPPLTARLRSYFGCSTLKGAYIENQGGSGSAGSHFERRVFFNEFMTASAIIDTRVTEFTLALLEGTGWYQVDYDMADPITWGRNQGCSFVEGPCMNKATKEPLFEEFCPTLMAKGCSWTRRAGSSCGTFSSVTQSTLPDEMDWWGSKKAGQDDFSDNCPMQMTYSNLDCEDSRYQGISTLSAESFGYGNKCFTGTLYPGGKLSTTYPFCFKPTCFEVGSGKYNLNVLIGSVIATCTSEKAITVSGFGGVLNCPDPQEFCEQVLTEGNCRRGCSGRGTCVNRECECALGWTGYDCSKMTYVDGCTSCANSDLIRTSCFGDTCGCNPSNNTCMCLLGLTTGSICKDALKDVNYTAPITAGDNISPNQNGDPTDGDNNKTPNVADPATIDESKSNEIISNDSTMLPLIIGAVTIVVVAGGIFLAIKYSSNKKRASGSKKTKKAERNRKLKISKISIEESVNQSQSSPCISTPINLSLGVNGGDSPLHSQNSLVKNQLYGPSRFKREFAFQTTDLQEKTPKLEESVIMEHGVMIDLTRPEQVTVVAQSAHSGEQNY